MKFPADARQSTNVEVYPQGMLRMSDQPQTSSLWAQILDGLSRGGAYVPLGGQKQLPPLPTQAQLKALPPPTPQPPATNDWEAMALVNAAREADKRARVFNEGMGQDRTRPQAANDSKGWTYILPDGKRVGVGPEDPNWAGIASTPKFDPSWIVKALGGQ